MVSFENTHIQVTLYRHLNNSAKTGHEFESKQVAYGRILGDKREKGNNLLIIYF